MMMLKDVSPSGCPVQPPDGRLAFTACRHQGTALPITHAASLFPVTATQKCLPTKRTKEGLVQGYTQQDVGSTGKGKEQSQVIYLQRMSRCGCGSLHMANNPKTS